MLSVKQCALLQFFSVDLVHFSHEEVCAFLKTIRTNSTTQWIAWNLLQIFSSTLKSKYLHYIAKCIGSPPSIGWYAFSSLVKVKIHLDNSWKMYKKSNRNVLKMCLTVYDK